MYTCVAKNVVGKAYVAAYLQVASSPHLYLEWVAVVLFVFYRQLSLNIAGAKRFDIQGIISRKMNALF